MSATRRAHVALGALVAVVLAWGAFFIHRTSFVVEDARVFCLWDDAMISMHYARNLAEGHGLVWNPGEAPVQGISNLGVALGMAALHRLPLADTHTSLAFQALNLALLGLAVALVFRLARRLYPGRDDVALGAAVATALSGPLAFWSLVGSDVGLVAVWGLLGVLAIADAEAGRPCHLGRRFVLLGPGLLLRPDAILAYALWLAAAFALPGRRRAAWIGVATAALFLGGWLALGVAYYGDPLPNPYYLKATGHPRSAVLAKGADLMMFWLPRLALPVLVAGVAVWEGRARVTIRLCAALVLASGAYSLWVGGDWLATHGIRFLVPPLPLLLLMMSAGVASLVARSPIRAPRWRRIASFAAVTALAVLANAPATDDQWLGLQRPRIVEDNRANTRFARYVARHTDASTSVGVHWAGVPIYFSRRPGIDFLGRSDRYIAGLPGHAFKPGHSKWDWDYILAERRPDLIQGDEPGSRRARRVPPRLPPGLARPLRLLSAPRRARQAARPGDAGLRPANGPARGPGPLTRGAVSRLFRPGSRPEYHVR